MTLRAGSFDKAEPDWIGMIRDEGLPKYMCTHSREHKNSDAARWCAKKAVEYLKEHNTLPEGWVRYTWKKD